MTALELIVDTSRMSSSFGNRGEARWRLFPVFNFVLTEMSFQVEESVLTRVAIRISVRKVMCEESVEGGQ